MVSLYFFGGEIMDKTIKLRLRMKNGEYKTFMTDFVPFSKRQEYIRKEAELEERKDKDGNPIIPTQNDYSELQADFVASLFDDKEVTGKTILNGIDTLESNQIMEIIRYRVLGFSKEEEEAAKKALAEELLLGENSTI